MILDINAPWMDGQEKWLRIAARVLKLAATWAVIGGTLAAALHLVEWIDLAAHPTTPGGATSFSTSVGFLPGFGFQHTVSATPIASSFKATQLIQKGLNVLFDLGYVLCLLLLIGVLHRVARGQMFALQNAARLERVGWLLIAVPPASYICQITSLAAEAVFGQHQVIGFIENYWPGPQFGDALLAAAIGGAALVISVLVARGSQMQTELEAIL